MTNITIELPDEHAEVLRTRATSQGLTLKGWFQKIAEREAPADAAERAKAAVDRILAIQQRSNPDPDGWTIREYIDYGRP